MSSDESLNVSLEEINRTLEEIENRYSPIKTGKNHQYGDELEETLQVLSKEFDSLGLCTIDLTKPPLELFKQVVVTTRSLVHIYRKSLSYMKDIDIENRTKSIRSSELQKAIEGYKVKLQRCDDKNKLLQCKILKLSDENKELNTKMATLKEEIDKVKRYHNSRHNEELSHVKALKRENQRLKEMLEREHVVSKDEATLKVLSKYKNNEQILKNTVQNLQDNNRELLDEIFNLREHVLECSSKSK